MIEIVYNKQDDVVSTKNNLKLPKNIKQIGGGNSKRKIYIEDYVMSYISEIAKKTSNEKVVGVLLGENKEYEDARYLFIKGTIKVNDERIEEGRIILTEKSWTGIYDDIKKYFPTLNILGWFVVLGDVEELPKGSLEKTHIDNFAGNEKTLFMFETDKAEQGFFFYENGRLVKENGYYIYYERNEDMQEYMIYNRNNVKDEVEKKGNETLVIPEPEKSVERIKVKEKTKESSQLRFMYGLSSFLAVVVIVLAINMLYNYEALIDVKDTVDDIKSVFSQNVESRKRENDKVVELPGGVYATLEAPSEDKTIQPPKETMSETQSQTKETIQEESESRTQKAIKVSVHVVGIGDNLQKISRKYYGSEEHVEAIMQLNNIKDADKIYLGQELKLP